MTRLKKLIASLVLSLLAICAMAGTRTTRNLAYSASEAMAVLGEGFTAPVLSGATQNVEYTSSNPYVAMVKIDGTVVPLASGEAIITARAPEDNMYFAEEASYRLAVKYTSTTEGTCDTIQVDEAGGLRLAVADLESTRIRELTILGKLNAADLKFLREGTGRLANLESLDLSDVTLVSGEESYATVVMDKNTELYSSYTYYNFYISDMTYVNKADSESNGLGGGSGYYDCYGKGLGGAFAEMGLKRIVLPKNLTEIGELAFKDCKQLVEIVFPSGISAMKEKAFWNCTSLPIVNVPEKMTNIPDNLFLKCTSLVSVGDLSNITHMGKSAFEGCTSLIGDAKDMTLKIGALDSIPAKAFYGCTELSDIQFSNGLQYIGQQSFYGCGKLTSLTFPNVLECIDASAFANCASLETFNVPTSLERVSAYSFSNTLWMDNFLKSGNNEILYLGKIALACIYDEAYTDIELNFREGTTTIADNFGCYIKKGYIDPSASKGRIKKISLPSSLVRIGDYAFSADINGSEYNANITEITLPEKLEEIGDYAFCRCELLNAIEFPASLKHIGDYAFAYCKSISTLDLLSTIETIGVYAFRNCESLAKVRYDVPDAKGYALFSGSTGCTADKVIIGPHVKVLPNNIFSYANNLVKVEFEERESNSHLYIGNRSFSNCPNITKIEFPLGTDSIGEEAFINCPNLQSIELHKGLQKIGRWAFGNCTALSSLDFPEGLLYIDEIAFDGCTSLTEVTFPEGLEVISSRAFSGCTSLTAITFPESLKYISRNVFSNNLTSVVWNPIYCTTKESYISSLLGDNITSLEIGDKVENIPSGLCARLSITSIDLPASLKNIELYAFYNCNSLSRINLYASTPPTFVANYHTFANYNAEVHIPKGTLADYQATGWSKFKLIDDLEVNSITKTAIGDSSSIEGYYDFEGRKIAKPQNRMVIIRYSDGTSRKALVK